MRVEGCESVLDLETAAAYIDLSVEETKKRLQAIPPTIPAIYIEAYNHRQRRILVPLSALQLISDPNINSERLREIRKRNILSLVRFIDSQGNKNIFYYRGNPVADYCDNSSLSVFPQNDFLIARAQDGDKEAAEKILVIYNGLIGKVITGLFLRWGEKKDLWTYTSFALYNSTKSYDWSIPFSNFAYLCMQRKVASAVKYFNREKHRMLNETRSLHQEFGENLMLEDLITRQSQTGALADTTYTADLVKKLRNALEECTELERTCLLRFASGSRYKEIAYELNKSVKSVDNTLLRARKKIFRHIQYPEEVE